MLNYSDNLTMASYVTQPLDTIKTRMQSIEASKNYKNSFACGASILKNEGFLTLWSGAMPRLARLILSGGIVFTMYVFPYLSLSSYLSASW